MDDVYVLTQDGIILGVYESLEAIEKEWLELEFKEVAYCSYEATSSKTGMVFEAERFEVVGDEE